ncbi:sodium-dependent transporter [Teredinibacter sp. KSP-S5-2]|uniref:sodium-dependent transporter n=1 Tax=Teredinibacter sp. KSP-S5-2 TaxID=3034506 RepID=UPI002934E00B|nr:sodium-dependent transporter [Teredinibacter sp. KSP-S5-2]WNO08241.1 sodium-dependent transporter [Teredinibacter sp. KSP-S5-2]
MLQRKMHGVWKSRWTFVLAATGSAVGLGNIWKFPYITGENGGGAFVLVYLACIAVIGLPIMIAEVLIGRRGRQSPINSMRYVTEEAGAQPTWVGLGWMGVVTGLLILSFYSVVAGWALQYSVSAVSNGFAGISGSQASARFGELLGNPSRLILWHSVFILMTTAVVATGVTRGLGMVARVLMPLLVVMLILLVGYGLFQGNFAEAFSFMFSFKYDHLSWHGVLTAMGHAFFTLSLGMGAIMAYGAYMPDHANVGQTVITVGILDTVIALVAGLAIFPIVFANGLEASSGPGLIFESLPIAFGAMSGGHIFGTVFFVLVVIAAWSSAVSLIEPGVAWLVETGKFNRLTANVILGGVSWLIGVAAALSFNLLSEFKWLLGMTPFDFLDFMTSRVLLPLGGMLISLFVAWYIKKEVIEEEMDAEGHPMLEIWLFLIKWISPALVAIVFVWALWGSIAKLLGVE